MQNTVNSCRFLSKTVGDRRPILRTLLSSAIREISINGLRTVYLVGSAASEEMTLVLDQANDMIAPTDIDVVLDLSVLSYAKYRFLNMAGRLSEEISNKLSEKGLKTHVSVALTSFNVSKFLPSIKPNSVFMFELTPLDSQATKSLLSSELFLPTKSDSFDLTVSSLADYVFLKTGLLGSLNVREKCYVVAKRCLTLLNSLMLFKGLRSKSYKGRFALANADFEELSNVLTLREISLLKVLTEFKLSGNIGLLANSFGISKEDDFDSLFAALESFFKELSSKILMYEFQNMILCFAKNFHEASG